ncbi:hypothetical protein PV10_01038 [Exophiala mesophila]|uniref:Multicopper oxidase n=1 Tax=Exophiala mesophila TaxID=212818 RepID=A0A0D1X636_EXOME|nr:uncharacterized protein PV10_01038 [Exophiala mesophila]KIV97270.1 hypothetical protein PV10_01038 [Exophiala mesophila]
MAFTSLSKALAAATLAFSSFSLVSAGSQSTHVPFVIEATWGPTDPTKAISRDALLVNGSFPGPPLNLKVGETVDFTIINNTPDVTGIHFHGIRQLGTPEADGVPGVSQTVIKSGETYTYTWTAEDSGTYFYHAHYKGQMMDGLYGAIIIAPADDAETPFSQIGDVPTLQKAASQVETVFASDWSRYTFAEFFAIEQAANKDTACTDSIILNGQGSVYCPSIEFLTANAAPQTPALLNGTSLTAKGCIPANNPVLQGRFPLNAAALPPDVYDVCTPYEGTNYTYTVDANDGYAAMSFVNPGGFAILQVAIDSHKLIVYEINGNYIVPQWVDEITVGNGDRISFFVKLDQAPADYTIRVANAGVNQVVSGFGLLSYKGSAGVANTAGVINYGGQNTTLITSLNRALAAPYPAVSVAATSDLTYVLDISNDPSQPTDAWAWTLSGSQAYNQSRDDAAPPLLFQDPATVPDSDLILKTKYGQWVDLIIRIQGPLAQPHPIHKHANKFFAIGGAPGDFNFTTVAEAQAAGLPFNLANPPFVDGYTNPPAIGTGAWMVFRYQVDTPGAWLLHCHIQTHFSGGMGVAILDAIDKFPQFPSGDNGSGSGGGKGNSGSGNGNSGSTGGSSGNQGSGGDSNQYPPTSSGSGSVMTTVSGPTAVWSSSVAHSTGSPAKTGPPVATFTGAASATHALGYGAGLIAMLAALVV